MGDDSRGILEENPALREALERVASEQGIQDANYHVEPGARAGEGYTSRLYRAVIRGKDSARRDTAVHLMSKTTFVEAAIIRRLYRNEGFMYSAVLPAMEEVTAMRGETPWPRALYVSVDGDRSSPCVLVLSDLRADGFVMRRVQSVGSRMDAAHCRLALQQVARLHGAGLALASRRPDEFERLKSSLPDVYALPALQGVYKAVAQIARDAPGRPDCR